MPRHGEHRAKRHWSDGIHYVRDASIKDRHPMRFVVGAHKASSSTFARHAPDKDAAIEMAEQATKRHIKKHPAENQLLAEYRLAQSTVARGESGDLAGLNPPAGEDGRKTQLQPFATTHFNCIYANPVAQVWQCVSRGERKTGGRRRKDGSPAQGVAVYHDQGECAVLLINEPVRDEDGRVVIYPTWSAAAEAAQELYDNADEEDRLLWHEGDKKVWATENVDVIFDPEVNGKMKPFSLYLPEYRRPVFEDRTRPIMKARPKRINSDVNPQAALMIKEQRKKEIQLNRQPSFEERPLRFRSIHGAIEEAERRERMLKGLTVL